MRLSPIASSALDLIRKRRLALLLFAGLAASLAGCQSGDDSQPLPTGKQCTRSSQCGGTDRCVDRVCTTIGSGELYFATNPNKGGCTPLLAGSLEDSLASEWSSCYNPCDGLTSTACDADPRCQPYWAQERKKRNLANPPVLTDDSRPAVPACDSDACDSIDLASLAAECSGADESKLPSFCFETTTKFQACKPIPVPAQCEDLNESACGTRPDCQAQKESCPPNVGAAQLKPATLDPTTGIGALTQNICNSGAPVFTKCQPASCYALSTTACVTRSDCKLAAVGGGCEPKPILTNCSTLNEEACNARPDCQLFAEPCYCPQGEVCDCSGGKFIACRGGNPRNVCDGDEDCATGLRCDFPTTSFSSTNSLDVAGTFANKVATSSSAPQVTPITRLASTGQCVPISGCAGLSENLCGATPSCTAHYDQSCSSQSPYSCSNTIDAELPVSGSRSQGVAFRSPDKCVCLPTYLGCEEVTQSEIVADRSLLVQEPTVLDRPEYAFTTMIERMVGPGAAPTAIEQLLTSLTVPTTINGRTAQARSGVANWLAAQPHTASGSLDLDKLHMRPTAIINRIDLVSSESCGEARIIYGADVGATKNEERLMMILEFAMPNDGKGCQAVAAEWALLSRYAPKSTQFTSFLSRVTDRYFTPANLKQLRTNELLHASEGNWELREFALQNGAFVPRSCKDSPAVELKDSVNFIAWVRANFIEIMLGQHSMPEEFQAPSSKTNAAHVVLPTDLAAARAKIALHSCGGCHSGETSTPFTHVAERNFSDKRGAISTFVINNLPKRTEILNDLLGSTGNAAILRARNAQPSGH